MSNLANFLSYTIDKIHDLKCFLYSGSPCVKSSLKFYPECYRTVDTKLLWKEINESQTPGFVKKTLPYFFIFNMFIKGLKQYF